MKKALASVLVIIALLGMAETLAAGTQSDPLISQEYAEGAYRTALINFINDEVNRDQMNRIRLDALEEYVGFEFSSRFTKKSFALRDEITILSGTSFTLTSGNASILYDSGAVIDLSTGYIVKSGAHLTPNARYFCAEDTTATVLTLATSSGYVDGYHKIISSPITGFVERLYREILLRNPDEYGLQAWVERIVMGNMSGIEVARGFVFSQELTSRRLSDADFVEMLYRAILGRGSDAYGKEAWVSRLGSGMSRQQVFNGFAESVEFARICSDYGLVPTVESPVPAGIRVFVTRLYVECLGRNPDAFGRDAWMRRIHTGQMTGSQVAHGFVFSPELTSRNYSNEDFVEMLYRTMLGRESEPAGKAAWVARLNSGWSRQRVFEGFLASTEFTEICRTLGVRK